MIPRGLLVAIGAMPCKAKGHTMRTSGGHCVQCKPLNLTFTRRHHDSNYLYIAYTKRGSLVKIGLTNDVAMREATLRAQAYGGFDDWEIKHFKHTQKAGEIEKIIHNTLSPYRHNRATQKDGRSQMTYEIFKCPLKIAKHAFDAATQWHQDSSQWRKSQKQ